MSTPHLDDRQLLELVEHDTSEASAEASVASHLASCAACRRRRDEYRATLQLTARIPAPAWNRLQTEALVHRVRRAVHRRGRARSSSRRRPALAGVALVLVAILAAPGSLWQTPPPAGGVDPAAAARPAVAAEASSELTATDTDVAAWIESYLIDTASVDELLVQLDQVPEAALYALLEEE